MNDPEQNLKAGNVNANMKGADRHLVLPLGSVK